MIRILFFIDTTLSSGGAEKVLRTLVNNMDQSKFDITVLTAWPEDAEKYLAPGVHYRSAYSAKNAWNKLRFRLEAQLGLFYRYHITQKYDIEVAYLECGPTKVIAKSPNDKSLKLAWVHCDLQRMTDDVDGFVRKSKKSYGVYDKIVCVSRNVMDRFREIFPDAPASLVLYNAVDDAEVRQKAGFTGTDIPVRNRPVIATVGRMYPVKGYDRLLDAHRRLIREGNLCDLWILGEGPDRGKLEQMVREFGTGAYVHFLGFQANPYPFMDAADMLVCSSYYEGFSTVVTEALILGKPVVTTPCSGMDELLGDSEFGLITQDSTEGIYDGLKRMLEDPELREHYAQMAQKRGRAFSKAQLVAATEEFFCRELAQKRKET